MPLNPAPHPTEKPLLCVRQLSKQFGSTTALAPTDLDMAQHEFVTLLGPSGCGKSTLLRMLAGILAPSTGRIELAGQRIEALPPERRDVAMVFQTYALFPHLSVRDNLGFGLRMKKVAPAERERRIAHAAEICQLGALLQRMPRQLSGGQQQRVALARAIVMQPALMLFDEPLSNLDAQLRESLREELVRLHHAIGSTSLYVTHDQAEAMTMSSRIVVMNAGAVVETGSPMALYRSPRHGFTARFLGQTNLLSLVLSGHEATLPWGQRVQVEGAEAKGQVTVSLRPEDLQLRPDASGICQVSSVSFAGAQVHYTVRVGEQALRVTQSGAVAPLAVGAGVSLAAPSALQALAE
jgi:putative spermidine/putrescine transport system ATP-binding protein